VGTRVEGDWSLNNKEGQALGWVDPAPSLLPGGILVRSGRNLVGEGALVPTAARQTGYAVDKWLLFVTGGWRLDEDRQCEFFLCRINSPIPWGDTRGEPSERHAQRLTRWPGVEYALPTNWSIRSEYLYIKIPSYTTFTPGTGNGLCSPRDQLEHRPEQPHLPRGLTYKFDFGKAAPVVDEITTAD